MGLGLLGVAVGSSAMGLGRARGNVVLGQPLSLAVEIRVDQPEDATAQCFRAEVFHGDTRLDPSRVRLLVQAPAAGSQDAVLRIRTSSAIDEPVVGVVLNALCGQGGARRYDFLPDFPADLRTTEPVNVAAAPAAVPAPSVGSMAEEPVRSAVPAPASAPPPTPAPRPAAKAQPPRSASTPAVRAPATARTQPAPRPAKAAPRPAAPKAAPAAAAAASGAAAAGAARLTLDAPQGRSDGLQPSETLVSGPIDDAAQREAVAAIWRALRTTPEEIVRDRQRLLALEAQQGQRASQTSTAERELRERLERAERRLDEAESGRVDILLVYGLLALLALVAALAAYFWHRARQAALAAGAWSAGPDQPAGSGAAQSGPADMSVQPRSAVAAAKVSPADAFLGSEPDSAVGAVRGVDTDAVAAVVFAHDKPAPVDASRPVRPDEFFDVQQHADFFVSLGQYEQAIEVLKQHLDERQDMSPLAFLELFGIYHQLGRKDDFAALRNRFQQRFNARIPSFAAFTDEGLGLEDYPATMLAIETAWGHVRVLDTIEANLSRHPEDTGQPLDLAAYRDLLMLYGVAQDVFVPAGGTRPASSLAPFAASAPVSAAVPAPASASSAVPEAFRTADAGAAGLGAAGLDDLTLDLDTDAPMAPVLRQQHDMPSFELDIDLSTSPAPVAEPPVLSLAEVDIDLPLLDEPLALDLPAPAPAPAPTRPPGKPIPDSGLIDFDLFDPNTEARIAPKSTR